MKNTRKKKKVNNELEKDWRFLLVNLLSNNTFMVLLISLFLRCADKLFKETIQLPRIKFKKNILSNIYILLI